MQLQTLSLIFIHKNISLLAATSIVSRPFMAYNTTAQLDKLTCNNYENLGKGQDRFGELSWSKNDSNNLHVHIKVLKKDDNIEFLLVQDLTMGEADFNQIMRLRNQLVNEAENFAKEENLTPVMIPTMSKDMDEQLKLAHKIVDIVDRGNRKIWVTLLRYNVENKASFYAKVRLFAKKKKDKRFHQVVIVK